MMIDNCCDSITRYSKEKLEPSSWVNIGRINKGYLVLQLCLSQLFIVVLKGAVQVKIGEEKTVSGYKSK